MYKIIIIYSLLALSACNRVRHTAETDTETSQHADENVQHTLFSEQFEFYIEHPPLEAGVETEFLVHMTDLESYSPCMAGRVTVSIDGIRVTTDSPSSPGIFMLPFTPAKEGGFHAEFAYANEGITEEAEAHVDVHGEHADVHSEEPDPGEHSHEAGALGEIEFLKEQAWNSGFRVQEILPGPFYGVIPTSGEIMAVPGEKQNITAGSRGIVRFADPLLVQGSRVTRGQLLFILSSETLVEDGVKLRYEQALNRLEKSRSEYFRHLSLYGQKAISDRQLMESRTSYVEDSLRFFSLAENITADGVKVLAPVSGTIHELVVSDGEFTEPGRLLATLSSNRSLLLRADLPQQYFNHLNQIHSAHFRPAYMDRVFRVEELNGALLASGVSVAENNHYLPVIFRLQNNGQLLEGAFAEIHLLLDERQHILSLPLTALGEEQGGTYVYVQVSGETFTKRRVSIGESDGRFVEITEGLVPGERVVTEGHMLVKAASMATGVSGHGHAH